ncbi:MAG TPA: hypothetical protein VLH84_03465 [Patescibacteria group bacterium]|nr:hypothetical protein [Patescibacteria group bacterium]
MTTLLIILGIVLIAGAFLAAFALKGKKLSERKFRKPADAIGVVLALAILIFVEAVLQRAAGTSFYTIGVGTALQFFAIGAMQGMLYEYVGQLTFPLWFYPAAERHRYLLLGLPIFWGIFMLIMQDTWAIYRYAGAPGWLAFILTTLTQYGLIEGFNLITHSWKYEGPFKEAPGLIVGWVILTLTFVLLTNHFAHSPFGF